MRQKLLLVILAAGLADLGCSSENGSESGTETDTDSETETDTHLVVDPGIDWVTIEPGVFTMGSAVDAWNHEWNERSHPVSLTHRFQMASTELTREQWSSLGIPLPQYSQDSECVESDCPVEIKGQWEVNHWLNVLSAANGLEQCYSVDQVFASPYHCNGFRLPTEAEWEYAARAGTQTDTYNGDPNSEDPGQVINPIGWCSQWSYASRPVGQKEPNAFGLYDMIGNVSELTQWVGTYWADLQVNPFIQTGVACIESAESAQGPVMCTQLAVRGGSNKDNDFDFCRAPYRGGMAGPSLYPAFGRGLRPVRTLPGSELGIVTDTSPGPCPQETDYPCEGAASSTNISILEAAPIGDGAQFVAMVGADGFTGVVGAMPSGAQTELFTVVYDMMTQMETVRFLPIAEGMDRLVDVVFDWNSYRFVSVVCNDEFCALGQTPVTPGGGPLEVGEFTVIEGSQIPQGIAPRALLFAGGPIVVGGDGVAVYTDGLWQVVVAPGSGPSLNALDFGFVSDTETTVVAVGDGGRIVVGTGDQWEEMESGGDENLNDVVTLGWVMESEVELWFNAVGQDGLLLDGTPSGVERCTIYDEELTHVELWEQDGTWGSSASLYFVSPGGVNLVDHLYPDVGVPFCVGDSGPGDVLELDSSYCFDGVNLQWLRADGLYGSDACIVI